MPVPSIIDLKPFVPSRNYPLARQFYCDLGFRLNWSRPELAEFDAGGFRFFLQSAYTRAWAENFMLQLSVGDLDPWWSHIQASGLQDRYPGISVKAPAMQPWGLRVLYLTDPSGVLWHLAEHGGA